MVIFFLTENHLYCSISSLLKDGLYPDYYRYDCSCAVFVVECQLEVSVCLMCMMCVCVLAALIIDLQSFLRFSCKTQRLVYRAVDAISCTLLRDKFLRISCVVLLTVQVFCPT